MKKILLLAILLFFGGGFACADLSDSLFCLIKKDQVTISLKQTPGYYKCRDTIRSVEQLMINTAKDLMQIQTYINRGRDLEYRKSMKVQKKSLLDTLQSSRLSIIANMKKFEDTLLQKSIQYFIIKVTPYKISLQKSLVKIAALSGVATPELIVYAQLLTAQVSTIDALSKATTPDEINQFLVRYVYLKKEIQGKSE